MIDIRLSAVLIARDGFSGKPLAKNAFRVSLDGFAVKPEYRAGGYFVFVNLEPGLHEIRLEGPYFKPETVCVSVPESGYDERIVSMKPSERYPFGQSVTRLKLIALHKHKPAENELVLIASRSAFDPKIAQDDLKKGDATAKLYIRGEPGGLRLPAQFLLVDARLSEVCVLTEAADSIGVFRAPLSAAHKRGKPLYPAAEYRLDKNGELSACFRDPVEIAIFHEKSKRLEVITLSKGENEYVLEL